jgi:hypothetical protein
MISTLVRHQDEATHTENMEPNMDNITIAKTDMTMLLR